MQHCGLASLVALAGLLGAGPVGAAPVLKITRGCVNMFNEYYTSEVAQSLNGGWVGIPYGCTDVLVRSYATVLELTPTENGSLNCASTRTGAGTGSVCTATPDPGYTHGAWGGDECTGSAATPCTLSNVTSGKTVSATFTAIPGYVPTGAVVQILIDPLTPTTLYSALDGGGVYASTDSSANWSAINTDLTNLNVRALTMPSSSTLFAATYDGGVFKGTKASGSWSWAVCDTSASLSAAVRLRSLIVDSAGNLYAGSETGVFRNTTTCGAWTAQNTGMP